MSDTEHLDLAKASAVELAEFADRHGVAVEKLERCQEYLTSRAPVHAKFELLALAAEPQTDAGSSLVLRLVRGDGAWVELPTDFPGEQLLALLEILGEG